MPNERRGSASAFAIIEATDIFIRINSKGTALSQGDFVMSKIAADEQYGGNSLRKAIDYYAHLSTTLGSGTSKKK